MPLDSFANANSTESVEDVKVVYPEVLSQHLRAIGDAKLEHWSFQFVDRKNNALFAEMPEGTFATDIDEDGNNWVFRKLNNERHYFFTEIKTRELISEEITKIDIQPGINRIIVKAGEPLPTSTEERPLLASNTELMFFFTGTIEGQEVTPGGIGYLSQDIPIGEKPVWGDTLEYNASNNIVEILEPDLIQEILLNGSDSVDLAPSAKAVADIVNKIKTDYNEKISGLDLKTSTKDDNLQGEIIQLKSEVDEIEAISLEQQDQLNQQGRRIIAAENKNTQQDSRLTKIESRGFDAEEIVLVGDGVSQLFRTKLSNKYINKYVNSISINWAYLMGGKYIPMRPQDGHIERDKETGDCYLVAAFAGVMPNNAWEVTIQGRTIDPEFIADDSSRTAA